MRHLYGQFDLFSDNAWRETFQVIPKLPYSFSYRFQDAEGETSELQVLDWEAGPSIGNCLRSTAGRRSRPWKKSARSISTRSSRPICISSLEPRSSFISVHPIRGSSSAVVPRSRTERQLGMFVT